MFYFVYLLLLGGVWRGWQRVRRCEVGTLGLVVRKGVYDLLGVSRGSRGSRGGGGGDGCMKMS